MAKEFLPSWQRSETVHPLSEGRTLRTITYRDPATHLEVSREITTFPEKNVIEWVLQLHNGGTQDSPILENILPLDLDIPVPASGAVMFHTPTEAARGSWTTSRWTTILARAPGPTRALYFGEWRA